MMENETEIKTLKKKSDVIDLEDGLFVKNIKRSKYDELFPNGAEFEAQSLSTERFNSSDSNKSDNSGDEKEQPDVLELNATLDTIEKSKRKFVVDTFKEALAVVNQHEITNTVHYVISSQLKGFGNTDIYDKKHKVYWNDEDIEFTGVPFMVLNHRFLDCQHGKDRNIALKTRNKERKNALMKTNQLDCKRRVSFQEPKKLDCPAILKVKEIAEFPEFKVLVNTKRKKADLSRRIRELIKTKGVINFNRKFIVILPKNSDHRGHSMGEAAGMCQTIDARLAKKISTLVKEGVTSVSEMKRHLNLVVKNDLFGGINLPKKNNKRFYPRNRTIRCHMGNAKRKLRTLMIDDDCLQAKVKEWRLAIPNANIYFRSKTETTVDCSRIKTDIDQDLNSSNLLFVYQDEWQKRLLNRYGNELALLEAAHRCTSYALPLFFLTVKTNVDYQVVAVFVPERETVENIGEALEIIKKWNPSFNPAFFMTGYSNEEINAVKSTFDSAVFLSDFQCTTSWERWMKTNECSDIKSEVLSAMRSVATARTIEELEASINKMENSVWWNDPVRVMLVDYIKKYWLRTKEIWVWAYRQDRLLVNCSINNGTERKNESFKYNFIEKQKSNSLSAMLTMLIEEFFPSNYNSYCDENQKSRSSHRAYPSGIPGYLVNRPNDFVKHCMKKIEMAKAADKTEVTLAEYGKFQILCHETRVQKVYTVSFGDDLTMPYCACPNWRESAYPCQHFFAVMEKYPEWSWERISPLYIHSPLLVVDDFTDNFANNIESNVTIDNNLIDVADDTPVYKHSADSCRKKIQQIQDLTFQLENQPDALEDMHKQLDILEKTFSNYVP